MQPRRPAFGLAIAVLAAATLIGTGLTSTSVAAPIRVGIFKGTGQGKYWHTSIHTAGSAIAAILARPDTSNLGPNLIIPAEGFSTTFFGVDTPATGSGSQTPTAGQVTTFINALDTLDVVWIPNFVDFGSSIKDTAHRSRLENFIRTKGFLSSHWSADSYGSWPQWDSIQGTRFANKPSSDRTATLHLDSVAKNDSSYRFLNRGLPDSVNFVEEWISFVNTGIQIRGRSGLTVTVNIDEATYNGGLGGATVMGDHPMSWGRDFPEGGRFFYTGIGHRAQTFLNNGGNPSTPFLRRQLYNAILWAAKVDTNGIVSINEGKVEKGAHSRFADHASLSLSDGTLTVTLLRDGVHTVEIHALDGRRVAMRSITQRGDLAFQGLSPGVHLVAIRTVNGTATRLVRIP